MKIAAAAATVVLSVSIAGATAASGESDYFILADAEDGVPTYSAGKTAGQALLKPAFVQDIRARAGLAPFSADDKDVIVQTNFLTSTSERHIDALPPNEAGHRPPVPFGDRVGFVPINTNKNAHLDVEGTCIPIEEGKLVEFDGQAPHHTVVNSGFVSLLGPFHLQSMKGVGSSRSSKKANGKKTKTPKMPKATKAKASKSAASNPPGPTG